MTGTATILAFFGIVIFIFSSISHFSVANLWIAACEDGVSVCEGTLPSGAMGVWKSLPYGMWLFLAIEGLTLAVEDAKHPEKTIPRSLAGAIGLLALFGTSLVVVAPGVATTYFVSRSTAPLSEVLQTIYGAAHPLVYVVTTLGLCALLASFSSSVYAYSRVVRAVRESVYI